MANREEIWDWAEHVPQRRMRSDYEDYGWESRESVLPDFRDSSVRRMPYDQQRERRMPRSMRGEAQPGGLRNRSEDQWDVERGPSFERAYDYGNPTLYPTEHRSGGGMAYAPPERDYDVRTRGWESGEAQIDRPERGSSATAQGPFRGRGPRGYQRSAERIFEDVCERLTEHGHIDASDIEVRVENGEVTLAGTVNSRREKRMAEDIAEQVIGVRDIHNQIRVNSTVGQPSHNVP